MTRDDPKLDAVLAPLAQRKAPRGFAARLKQRYAAERRTRHQREAFVIAGACFLLLALVGLLAASLVGRPEGFVSSSLIVAGVAFRTTLHGLIDGLGHAAAGVFVLSALTAACCVAIAAIVRRETSLQ